MPSFEPSIEAEEVVSRHSDTGNEGVKGSVQETYSYGNKSLAATNSGHDTAEKHLPKGLEIHDKSKDLPEVGQLHPGLNHASVKVKRADGGYDDRGYDVYVPKNYDGQTAVPMMMVLHGVAGGGDASKGLMERETGMDKIADEKNMIVVYPWAKTNDDKYTAFGHTFHLGQMDAWNSPGAGLTKHEKGYDDVDYIKGILDQLHASKDINVDKDRQYIAGFSDGGEFAQHVVGRLPGEFAGLGSVHGTLLGTEHLRKPGQDPMPYVDVLSDSDHMLPMDGGRGLMTKLMVKVSNSKPLEQFKKAAEANSCAGTPTVETRENLRITEYKPEQCAGYPVKQYVVEGGWRGGIVGGIIGRSDAGPAEHAWDGTGEGGWPIIGDKNRKVDTSGLLVEGLLPYRRRDGRVDIKRDLTASPNG